MSDSESKIRETQVRATQAATQLPTKSQDQPAERGSLLPLDPATFSLRVLRAEAESNAISHALQQTGGNRKRAAALLRISYRGLLYKMQRFNIGASGCRVVPFPGKQSKVDDFSGA
jgi:DNA-binding NtrC family response regulator